MRRTIGVTLPSATVSNVTSQFLAPFSTSSGSGGGRGRGRGGPITGSPFDFTGRAPGRHTSNEFKHEPPHSDSSAPPVSGIGRGHGRSYPSPSPLPSFLDVVSSLRPPAAGRGRVTDPAPPQRADDYRASVSPATGRGRISGPTPFRRTDDSRPQFGAESEPAPSQREDDYRPPVTKPKKPFLFTRKDERWGAQKGVDEPHSKVEENLPRDILPPVSGFGRGQPMKQPVPEAESQQENRHLRPRQAPAPTRQPMLNRENALKNARNILSKAEDEGSSTGRGGGGGRGFQGRGRGRERGRFGDAQRGGRGRFGDIERGGRDRRYEDAKYSDPGDAGLYLTEEDKAEWEKFAKKVGPEVMNQLEEGFEEAADRVLPSPLEDEYVEAFDINCSIEFEPEYLMGDFERNPDIDEKPPIPLRDALEKMKPFLMKYEGIQSQEEWEEIMEETMARVPLLKKIVDHYSGPDRVTAKKQTEELERVAGTIPKSAPSSVKQFTDRAVLSLKSNPGWGFDKKCQFMDKLVWEVSQHYK